MSLILFGRHFDIFINTAYYMIWYLLAKTRDRFYFGQLPSHTYAAFNVLIILILVTNKMNIFDSPSFVEEEASSTRNT